MAFLQVRCVLLFFGLALVAMGLKEYLGKKFFKTCDSCDSCDRKLGKCTDMRFKLGEWFSYSGLGRGEQKLSAVFNAPLPDAFIRTGSRAQTQPATCPRCAPSKRRSTSPQEIGWWQPLSQAYTGRRWEWTSISSTKTTLWMSRPPRNQNLGGF